MDFVDATCSADAKRVREHPAFLYLIAALADENLAGSDELAAAAADGSPVNSVWKDAMYGENYNRNG